DALPICWTGFVEERSVPPSLEVDEHDSSGAVHALALLDGVPAGTGRFVFVEPRIARIGRMAVVDDARGKGLGLALLRFLEAEAHNRGATRFTLNAQVAARRFYDRAGYRAAGALFEDDGV